MPIVDDVRALRQEGMTVEEIAEQIRFSQDHIEAMDCWLETLPGFSMDEDRDFIERLLDRVDPQTNPCGETRASVDP